MAWPMISNLLGQLSAILPMPSDAALLEDDNDWADRYDTLIEEISQQFSDERPSTAEEAQGSGSWQTPSAWPAEWASIGGTLHLIERCTPRIAYPVVRDRAVHGPPGSQYWCAFTLGRRRDSADLPLFLTLLHDDMPEVQAQALHALVMLAQAVSLTHIRAHVQPLLDHPDAHVRKVAQRALDAIGASGP